MNFKLFDKEIYKNRRAVLRKNVGDGIILLLGNEESSMNYKDNWYHFRQDSTFLYYFGLDVPGLAAIIDTATGEEIIFGNELTIDDIVWTGPLPTLKEMALEVNVINTKPYGALENYISVNLSNRIHFNPPYRPENKIKLSELFGLPISRILERKSVELIQAIVKQRSYKEDCEIAEMEKAVLISVNMHLAAMKATKPHAKEYEIVAKVKEVAMAANAGIAYGVILTTQGQTLHTHYHGNTMLAGQMILCDAGAENDMHYAGDLTSTFPVGTKFTERQQKIYAIVLNAHETAVAMLKPGILFRDIYLKACETLVEGLIEVNLMKGDPKKAVESGAHAMFFQCGLGHMIGLDVHDMEDLGEEYVGYTDTIKKSTQFGMKSLRLGRELEAGFTLTVEPGIYFIPELIDRWRAENKCIEYINYEMLDTYRDFTGIRVEENFLITHNGYRLLGKSLPKTIQELEDIRA
jgi:Xaa-Pro aminopeptidase